jgi:hypothetical protein
MYERINAVWLHVAKSRANFESKPDRGLIGKDSVRWLNKFWNYLIIGFIGTLLISVVQPTLTIVNVIASVGLVLTSLAWAPGVAILRYFSDILIYNPERKKVSFYFYNFFPFLL